ncbi:hypothetical protein OIU84_015854 [Salix udensis]|uniref:Uncharacterized protein n=1 Tax=Salix udensis TaxID=889485 RepID=A0AAD6NPQ5_9ROSI|nr:hypothetical protein OIU84_015854 [Salix udensis]
MLVLIMLTVLDDVAKCNKPLYGVEKVEIKVLQDEKSAFVHVHFRYADWTFIKSQAHAVRKLHLFRNGNKNSWL